ncbi:hypothetical protein [Streptomyces longwoodensis]|uniref:hypothetical protein n=1 Tax=Streptomyces longwoodensis TaxID=68231 RepID=UPI0038702D08
MGGTRRPCRLPAAPGRITIGLLEALAIRLARLEYTVPAQDLTISLRRIPARPRSDFEITGVRAPAPVGD